MQEEEEQHYIVRTKTYIAVWLGLLALTALTIKAALLQLGALGMLANLLIASSKASLVIWFFMHLKYEKRLLKLMLLIPIATLTIIIGLTFIDVWYR
jgi:cytochrome c oxidase subunit 4